MADANTGILSNLKVNIPNVSQLPANMPLTKEIKYIDRTIEKIFEQTPIAVLKVGVGVLIIVLGWMLAGWVGSRLSRLLERAHVEPTLASFLGSTSRFIIFFNIFIIALTFIGVSSTSLAALLGAIGIAVGFALRGTLGSIAGGIMLMVHRPFKAGDWVEITSPTGSPSGTVKRIGLFSTEINTPEFVRVFVPNAMMWEGVVRNDTYNRMRMLKLDFGLGYEVNVRDAFKVITNALAANPLILKTPEILLTIEKFEEKGVMCALNVWVRTEDRRTLRNTVLLDVMEALQKADMRMAFMDKPEGPLPADKKPDVATEVAQKPQSDAERSLAAAAKDGKLPAKK